MGDERPSPNSDASSEKAFGFHANEGRAEVVERTDAATIQGFVGEHAKPGTTL